MSKKKKKMQIRDFDIGNYIGEMTRRGLRRNGDNGIMMNSTTEGGMLVLPRQPYRMARGRILAVTQGSLEAEIDLLNITATAGQLIVMPPESVATIVDSSTDFTFCAAVFSQMPPQLQGAESFVLNESEVYEWTLRYMSLIFDAIGRKGTHPDAIQHLFDALVIDTFAHRSQGASGDEGGTLLSRFVRLVNREGGVKRTAAWYADRLCVTPGHLSAMVKRDSGQSPLDWINRALIREAKLQLRHTPYPIADIAERLGFATPSFFIHFFRQHTGITPLQYRKQG